MIGHVVYWTAVLAVSLALVIGFVLFLESRDASSVSGGDGGASPTRPAPDEEQGQRSPGSRVFDPREGAGRL